MIVKKKALFFDIDGTLLSEHTGKIPASALLALEQAQKMGHMTFINTGRTYAGLPSMFLELPFSGLVCGCGTYVDYQGEVLLQRSIAKERMEEIVETILDCRGEMILEGLRKCYVARRKTRFPKLERTRKHFEEMGERLAYIEDGDYSFDKFVVFTDGLTDKNRMFNNFNKDMEVYDRQGGFYEIVPQGYSKATAIDFVLKHFEMDKSDAYVFGDSSNDLSMFQSVGHAIAMGEHDPILDPYTEYVTKTVEDDGLIYAMRHYGLIPDLSTGKCSSQGV